MVPRSKRPGAAPSSRRADAGSGRPSRTQSLGLAPLLHDDWAPVGLVLGPGARDRAAHADLIPGSLPGVGYVSVDGITVRCGNPLSRGTFARDVWRPALKRAELSDTTSHGLRHSFVASLVAAGCNVREVSEWAGHNSVAFTLTRFGGLSRTARRPLPNA